MVEIPVRCPKCQKVWNLQPQMVGKLVRCPNSICREVFLVPEPGPGAAGAAPIAPSRPPAGPPPVARHQAGSVGDLIPMLEAEEVGQQPLPEPVSPVAADAGGGVPILPAEIVEVPKSAPPARRPATPTMVQPAPSKDVLNWRDAPPPQRRQGGPAAGAEAPPSKRKKPPDTMVATPPAAKTTPTMPAERESSRTPSPEGRKSAEGPVEVPAGAWEPPPVRRPQGDGVGEGMPSSSTATQVGAAADLVPQPVSRRLMPKIVIACGACFVLALIVGVIVWQRITQGEQYQFEQVRRLYEEHNFGGAAEKFRKLEENSSSDEKAKYRFFADLCEAVAAVNRFNPDIPEDFEKLKTFCEEHAEDPWLKEKPQPANLGQSFHKSVEDITERAAQGLRPDLLDMAKEALTWAGRFRAEVGEEKLGRARTRIQEVAAQIDKDQKHRRLLADVEKAADQPSAEALEKIDVLLKRNRREFPDLENEPRVTKALAQINAALSARVPWKDGGGALPAVMQPMEEVEPSLHVVLPLTRSAAPPGSNARVVLALARGVLYALEPSTGGVQWATRVGIDTGTLPVRLPATEIAPEILLVLSSDTDTLTARDARTGQPLWSRPLFAPCLGRPVIVERNAYVPTYDAKGKVHVIGVAEGRLVGWYELGQPLSVGGAHQEGTNLLYFPADKRSIFVLDTTNRKQPCVAVLPSGHPSGSLRSEPIIISREELRKIQKLHLDPDSWPDNLILSQADGLNATKLRVFSLPPQGAFGRLLNTMEPQIPGWTWFPPYHDGEQLVQVTDAGQLGLFGIKQVNNLDRDLFLETKEISLKAERPQRGRAQIVQVMDDDLWVLAQGELRYLHFDRYGQRLVDLWPRPLPLGSPLHANQVEGKSLFVVTQSTEKPTCLATAVDAGADAEKATIRWQRQLGFLPQGEPLIVGSEVLAVDEGGGLFAFDPSLHSMPTEKTWQPGGRLVGGPPTEDGAEASYLVPSRKGASAYTIGSGKGKRIYIRKYESGKPVSERQLDFPGLAGTPGVGDDCLVLPLGGESGQLLHVPFDDTKSPTTGPTWRARDAEPSAPGHVVHLGDKEFLATGGTSEMFHWHWSGGNSDWDKISAVTLPEHIVAPPLVLPKGDDAALAVIVAGARGTLSLLREEKKNRPELEKKVEITWPAVRSWQLGGRITSGPFLRGSSVGCIIDNKTLVWIDPENANIAWKYRGEGEGIVGVPQRVGDLLLVAHRSGLFVGLDPKTGQPIGPGYRLKAKSVGPAASPVAFGPGRAFAPLTDGTILLLSLKQLRHLLRDVPAVW